VEVLLRIYAKCLDGGDALIRRRVQAALGYAETRTPRPRGVTHSTSIPPSATVLNLVIAPRMPGG
jgi:hypothetical protein